ncbi:hypothetical protein EXIGLDRAFT_507475 [Exidia glandulosa HHB12029]|uniref:Uncharacterized protein n=1 Tax=Exidia glandulosa HHB12029 TaxID=1314781 RepID=A0A165PBQ2_EXIGL|nr:hypothetical protein EXIGLDRAFT_507475 [Exidia glandulosa HHB12029]
MAPSRYRAPLSTWKRRFRLHQRHRLRPRAAPMPRGSFSNGAAPPAVSASPAPRKRTYSQAMETPKTTKATSSSQKTFKTPSLPQSSPKKLGRPPSHHSTPASTSRPTSQSTPARQMSKPSPAATPIRTAVASGKVWTGRARSPTPPTDVVEHSRGKNLYTERDKAFAVAVIQALLYRDPDTSRKAIGDYLARKAPHHSWNSWSQYIGR